MKNIALTYNLPVKADGTQPKLGVARAVVRPCSADADFAI